MTEEVDLKRCPICESHGIQVEGNARQRSYSVQCPRCTKFEIEAQFVERVDFIRNLLGSKDSRKRANASSWLSYDPDVTNLRTEEALKRLAEVRAPRILERVEILLQMLEKETVTLGESINICSDHYMAKTWSLNRREIFRLAQFLEESGLVTVGSATLGDNGRIPIQIAAAGWSQLEQMRRGDIVGVQGFVAMAFSEDMKPVYDEAIAPAIRAAGYQPHRVDGREYEGKIDDEIVAQIRRSRFMVADFTKHRAGVYYETGFGHGLGMPVFFTCRKDDADELHFDVRQYNTIRWEGHDDLKQSLQIKIESVMGRGPLTES